MRTLADFVMRSLGLAGAEVVFGYPGQSNLALLHAARGAGLRYVQTGDERAAGFAATGYALSTQKPGVVCVSKGPAATNLLTPLVSAMKDGVPLIVVTGNVARACHGRNAFQELDVCRAFTQGGAVKLARYCGAPGDIDTALADVLAAARTAPFGPVLIDIAYDLLTLPHATAPLRSSDIGPVAEERCVDPLAVDAAVALLIRAERPVIIAGRGARRDYPLVRAFATTFECPVVHTMGGTGVMASDHRLYGGLLRHNGSRTAARLVERADVILALGAGLDERATGDPAGFARHAVKIQVDIDAEALRRNQVVDLAVHGSIRAFLEAIAWRLATRASHWRWIEEMGQPDGVLPGSGVQEERARLDGGASAGRLSARDVIACASEAFEQAIVVKDSGSHKYWVTNFAPCADPSQSIASCHFGSMGFALPAAIGASLGNPQRPVIAACGDGGLLMALPDLLTAAHEGCDNLKILVFNNAGLGSTRDYERRTNAGLARISDFSERLSFAAYARAMGIASTTIAAPCDLRLLDPVLAAPGLAVIECLTDPAERVSPSVSYLGPLARLADEDCEYVTT